MTLPVVVLSGFLGAGKTTLLRRLLAEASALRIGVVLNELGVAGIDTVSARAFQELTDACACCVRSDDFVAAMREMAARGDLDLVILETTGVADPLPIMWRLENRALLPEIQLECVIAAVDPTGSHAHDRDEWAAQVQAADWIVLTKTDIATPAERDQAARAVRALQPGARFLEPAMLAQALINRPPDLVSRELPAFAPARHSRLSGVILSDLSLFSLDALEDCFESLAPDVLRAKAIAQTDRGWVALHRVGPRMSTELDQPPPPHGESRFAFFGDDLESRRSDLTAALAFAKIPR